MSGPRTRSRRGCLTLLLALWSSRASGEEPTLSLADLAAYRAALTAKAEAPPARVGFRDLWGAPERHRGRLVRVEGRLVRRFRQEAFGTFPPLVEAWAVSPAGDPFCLVFPDGESPASPPLGTPVRFVGTFLKRVRYQAGDGPRLAPLIVGGGPLVASARAPATSRAPRRYGTTLDWTAGLAVAAFVAFFLARMHLNRPISRHPGRAMEPPPDFLTTADDVHLPGATNPAEDRP
jgi:hypothetical protein